MRRLILTTVSVFALASAPAFAGGWGGGGWHGSGGHWGGGGGWHGGGGGYHGGGGGWHGGGGWGPGPALGLGLGTLGALGAYGAYNYYYAPPVCYWTRDYFDGPAYQVCN